MAELGALINNCTVLASGTLIAKGRDEVFILPFGGEADYKIRLAIDFSERYSERPKISGTPGPDYFDVKVMRGWYDGKNGAFYDLLVGESSSANLYMNLFFAIAGTLEENVISYSYTIYVKNVESSE